MATSLIFDRSALSGFFSTPEQNKNRELLDRILPAFTIDPSQSSGRVHTRGRLADIEGTIEYGRCADPRMMPPSVASSVTYDVSPYGLTSRVCLGLDRIQTALGAGGLVQLEIKDMEDTILKAKLTEVRDLMLNTNWTGYDNDPAIAWSLPATAQPLDDLELLIDAVDSPNVMVIGPSALNYLRATNQFLSAMPQTAFGNPSRSGVEAILSDRFGMEVIVPRAKNGAGQFIFGDFVFVGHIEPGFANPRGGIFGSSALLRPQTIPLSAEVWHNPLPGAVSVGADELKVGGEEDMIAVSLELGALLYNVDLS